MYFLLAVLLLAILFLISAFFEHRKQTVLGFHIIRFLEEVDGCMTGRELKTRIREEGLRFGSVTFAYTCGYLEEAGCISVQSDEERSVHAVPIKSRTYKIKEGAKQRWVSARSK